MIMKTTIVSGTKPNGRIAIGILTLAVFTNWLTINTSAAGVAPELEKAVLAEDWKSVAHLTADNANITATSAVHRFLAGHACLALNRNNESVRFFRDTGADNDTAQWSAWTKELVTSHPESSVTTYLRGDSLARLGEFAAATSAFSECLRRSPRHAMSLNARAVCYSAVHKWNEAIVDLDDAARANSDLAEIHANRGTINIRRSLGAPGAKAAFTRALEISPDYFLAKIGLASALYGEGNWNDAEKALEKLEVDPESRFLVDANLLLIHGNSIESLALSGGEKYAGTTIDRQRFDKEITAARDAHAESMKMTQNSWGFQGAGNSMKDLGIGAQWAGKTAKAFAPKIENDHGKWRITAVDVGGGFKSLGKDLRSAGSVVADIGNANRSIAALRAQDSANHFRAAQSIAQQAKTQGGVNTEDLRRGFLDKNEWGLLARFALQYPDGFPASTASTNLPSSN